MNMMSLCQIVTAVVAAAAVIITLTAPQYDPELLKASEHFILHFKLNQKRIQWKQEAVGIANGNIINTVVVKRANGAFPSQTDSEKRTLVMLHGWCGAIGYWVQNFDGLLDTYDTIYAVDLLGWGRSSRPDVSTGLTAIILPRSRPGCVAVHMLRVLFALQSRMQRTRSCSGFIR